uniref:Chemotaxis protein n=1 Tax=Mesocestoides corti TaxID=53468 RepID=A0A5K3FY86_MESCO
MDIDLQVTSTSSVAEFNQNQISQMLQQQANELENSVEELIPWMCASAENTSMFVMCRAIWACLTATRLVRCLPRSANN